MNAFFDIQGKHVFVEGEQTRPLATQVPVGTYMLAANPKHGFFLERIDDFVLPPKVFGSINRYADRILRTFDSRPAATGVMLAGEKGSGKSLLSKLVSTLALQKGVSTLVVNFPACGPAFNAFIQSLNQPFIVLFDEFEKVYHETNNQEALLTLMDGMFDSKKLFILTCNNEWRIDTHMRNRPGRLYYSLKFKGMEPGDIEEYIKDELKNQDHAAGVLKFANMFFSFNFDMLKALVEEMNRYDEPASVAHKMLNAKPDNDRDNRLKYDLVVLDPAGKKLTSTGRVWTGTPFVDEDELNHEGKLEIMVDNPEFVEMAMKHHKEKLPLDHNIRSHIDVEIGQDNQVVDEAAKNGAMVFVNEEKYKVVFTPKRPTERDYSRYLAD